MSKPGQHVVPSDEGWAVRKAGSRRASGTYATKQLAIQHARELAQKQKTELYIHGRDGKIQERATYGEDAVHTRG